MHVNVLFAACSSARPVWFPRERAQPPSTDLHPRASGQAGNASSRGADGRAATLQLGSAVGWQCRQFDVFVHHLLLSSCASLFTTPSIHTHTHTHHTHLHAHTCAHTHATHIHTHHTHTHTHAHTHTHTHTHTTHTCTHTHTTHIHTTHTHMHTPLCLCHLSSSLCFPVFYFHWFYACQHPHNFIFFKRHWSLAAQNWLS